MYLTGPLDPYEALDFLFHPLPNLFREQNIAQTVKKLEVLAVRFEDKVLGTERVHWESLHSTDFSFFNAIIDINPKTLAGFITQSDCAKFSPLSHEDFRSPNRRRLLKLGKGWNTLANDVTACVIADSGLVQTISKLAVVLLPPSNIL